MLTGGKLATDAKPVDEPAAKKEEEPKAAAAPAQAA